ncbi:MAG: hypothetical protein L6R36_005780 [Xanthoria steineri]|nr:MAG: hypothetical protein L6R36_005780 [Xanthoria steineri]
MPRTLPWLKDQRAPQAKATRPPPPKRSRAPDSDSDASDNARSLQRTQARQRRELAQGAGRTPSTSPPPAPPAVEYVESHLAPPSPIRQSDLTSMEKRYMHEGLAHDDIYIMVEDEFLSAAQLFTSHLHHAEYVRLKNAAKARNGSTVHPIPARPTDSITAMRAETKKKKEAEVRTGKNRAALDRMISDTRANVALTSDEEHSEDEDEEDEQPWAGTSLQGLMAPAARKNLTSLSGLQGIQSSTRAANGYSKPDEANQSSRTHEIFKPPQPQPQPQPAPSQTHIAPNPPPTSKNHPPTLRSLSPSDSSSDDLNAPSTRPPRTTAKNHTSSHPPPPKPNPSNPLTLAAEDLFHEQKTYHGPKASTPQQQTQTQTQTHNHKQPGSSPPSRNDEVAAARRRLEQRRERAAAAAVAAKKTNEGPNGNGNVNEIPVFLV